MGVKYFLIKITGESWTLRMERLLSRRRTRGNLVLGWQRPISNRKYKIPRTLWFRSEFHLEFISSLATRFHASSHPAALPIPLDLSRAKRVVSFLPSLYTSPLLVQYARNTEFFRYYVGSSLDFFSSSPRRMWPILAYETSSRKAARQEGSGSGKRGNNTANRANGGG